MRAEPVWRTGIAFCLMLTISQSFVDPAPLGETPAGEIRYIVAIEGCFCPVVLSRGWKTGLLLVRSDN